MMQSMKTFTTRFFCLAFVLISALTVPNGAVGAGKQQLYTDDELYQAKRETVFIYIEVPKNKNIELFSSEIINAISKLKNVKTNLIIHDRLHFILWYYSTSIEISMKEKGFSELSDDNKLYAGWLGLYEFAMFVEAKKKNSFTIQHIFALSDALINQENSIYEFFNKKVREWGHPVLSYVKPENEESNIRIKEHQKQLENILN